MCRRCSYFHQPSLPELDTIRHILGTFGQASGLVTMLQKSSILRFPGQLVFPLLLSRPKKLTKAHLQPIIDKTRARLPSWKGRLTLINSVLSSIPRYTLMVFLLSKWAKKQLGRICGSFLWMVCDNASGGQCHVSWKRCMHPSIWVDLASWTLKIQPRTSHTVALVRLD